MYIETDTVADVRNLVADTLKRQINSLNGDIAAHKNGNTAIVPKAQIRRKAIELAGYVHVYNVVFHWSDAEGYDPTLLDAAHAATTAAAALYGKTTI